MIYRLVFENLKHRPVRTLLSVFAIGVEVTLILTLVGVSHGVLDDMASRSRGTGADIIIRPPDSSGFTFSLTMPEKIVDVVRAKPHVAIATGTFVKYIDSFNSITGIHLDEFNAMSGGLKVTKGPDVSGSRMTLSSMKSSPSSTTFSPAAKSISATNGTYRASSSRASSPGPSRILLRCKDNSGVLTWFPPSTSSLTIRPIPAAVKEAFEKELPTYKVDSIEEFVSLFSTNSVPYIEAFTQVVIGIAVLIGFLVVCLSMYTAVLERTREIGILKALGASPGYIVGILLRETVVLALTGTVVGILMTYGTRSLLGVFAASFPQEIVPDWYLLVTGIALAGAIVGALYPGLRAARQDAIEALAYD